MDQVVFLVRGFSTEDGYFVLYEGPYRPTEMVTST